METTNIMDLPMTVDKEYVLPILFANRKYLSIRINEQTHTVRRPNIELGLRKDVLARFKVVTYGKDKEKKRILYEDVTDLSGNNIIVEEDLPKIIEVVNGRRKQQTLKDLPAYFKTDAIRCDIAKMNTKWMIIVWKFKLDSGSIKIGIPKGLRDLKTGDKVKLRMKALNRFNRQFSLTNVTQEENW